MEQTADLQAQIDRLSLALHQWRQTQDHLVPMEHRLYDLTERCAEILNRWTDTDQRHAQAVSAIEDRLHDWNAVEDRLHQDSLHRIRELEQTIEHEWKVLREVNEEPVNRLREQAAALGETCMAAANLALRGFERTEARLAALESDLQGRLAQLSHDIQAALAESRRDFSRPTPMNVAPFPLEGVVRIHEEIRAAGEESEPAVVGAAALQRIRQVRSEPVPAALVPDLPRQLPEAAALVDRMSSLEREVTSGKAEARETASAAERHQRSWRFALVAAAAIALAGSIAGLTWTARVNARLEAAAARVAVAEEQAASARESAARQLAARQEAERQITEARQSATQAQVVGNVLAAPDLMRFSLTSADGSAQRSYAQVLFSRTRGLVLSASFLPPAPAGQTYQVWLVGGPAPVAAGLFTPDAAGRATFVSDALASAPRPVGGVIVTLEPAGGQPAPTGVTVLARAVQ